MRSLTVNIDFVGNCHIVSQNTDIFQPCPSPHSTMPSNNSTFDPSVVFDSRPFEQDASLKSNSITDDAVRTNCYVRANATIPADFNRCIDKNISPINKCLKQSIFCFAKGISLPKGVSKGGIVSWQD